MAGALEKMKDIMKKKWAVGIGLLPLGALALTVVHVGDPYDMPVVNIPTHARWEWEKVIRHGDVVKDILDLAREPSVDLMVMTTQGHDGFLDALRGSTTDRVLRGARGPLLAIPALRKDALETIRQR